LHCPADTSKAKNHNSKKEKRLSVCNFTTDSKFFGNSLINFVLKFLALTLELVGEGGSLRFSGALWINGRDPVGSVYHIQTFPAGIPQRNLLGAVA